MVEYTGMLGAQGLFEKIIAICKEFVSESEEQVAPWQLQLHEFQALLALNQHTAAIKLGKSLLTNPSITQSIEGQLRELIKETEEELSKNEPLH